MGPGKKFHCNLLILSGMWNYRMAHALTRSLPYLAIMTPEKKKRGLQIFDSFIDFFSSANTDRRCTYRVNKIQKRCWPIVCTAFESSKAALRSVNLKKKNCTCTYIKHTYLYNITHNLTTGKMSPCSFTFFFSCFFHSTLWMHAHFTHKG